MTNFGKQHDSLGAKAVLISRPCMYVLAVADEQGGREVLRYLT